MIQLSLRRRNDITVETKNSIVKQRRGFMAFLNYFQLITLLYGISANPTVPQMLTSSAQGVYGVYGVYGVSVCSQ